MENKRIINVLIRNFTESDLFALWELITQTIDIIYVPVYPAEAIAYFKEYHNQSNILQDAGSGCHWLPKSFT